MSVFIDIVEQGQTGKDAIREDRDTANIQNALAAMLFIRSLSKPDNGQP